jgi:hypothetical protein
MGGVKQNTAHYECKYNLCVNSLRLINLGLSCGPSGNSELLELQDVDPNNFECCRRITPWQIPPIKRTEKQEQALGEIFTRRA